MSVEVEHFKELLIVTWNIWIFVLLENAEIHLYTFTHSWRGVEKNWIQKEQSDMK